MGNQHTTIPETQPPGKTGLYRPESVFAFWFGKNAPLGVQKLFAVVSVMAAGFVFITLTTPLDFKLWPSAVTSAVFALLYAISGAQYHHMYVLGRNVWDGLGEKPKKLSLNVSVYVIDFDIFSTSSWNARLSTPIYSFDEADLILTSSSVIVLGRNRKWPGGWVAPVEITKNEPPQSHAHQAKCLRWDYHGEYPQIHIADPHYGKEFRLIFTSNGKEMEQWLFDQGW